MKPVKFSPIGENLVVLPDEKVDKTPGGIIMPEKTKNIPDRGVVVAVGDGYITRDSKKVPLSVTVGQRVVYSPMNGIPLNHDEVEYMVLREADLIVVLHDGETWELAIVRNNTPKANVSLVQTVSTGLIEPGFATLGTRTSQRILEMVELAFGLGLTPEV